MADLTLAVAGHADNRPANVEALLSDRLRLGAPDADGFYPKPDRYRNLTFYALLTDGQVPQGLKPALKLLWDVSGSTFEIVTDDVAGDVVKWAAEADDVHVAADPAEKLISLLSAARSSQLLINWDERDADDERLIQLAHAAPTITVRDLVEGLVEIVHDDPEPAPQPPEPAGRRRKAREVLEEQPEELEDPPVPDEAPQEETPEEPQVSTPSHTPAPQEAAAKPVPAAQVTLPTAAEYTLPRELVEQAYGALVSAADYHNYLDSMDAIHAGKALDALERSPLTHDLANTAEMLRAVLYQEVPYAVVQGDAARKKTPAPATAGRVVWDEAAQEWRKAGRGRIRAGTRTGTMDAAGNVREDQ